MGAVGRAGWVVDEAVLGFGIAGTMTPHGLEGVDISRRRVGVLLADDRQDALAASFDVSASRGSPWPSERQSSGTRIMP